MILGLVMAVFAMLGCTLFADVDPYNFGSFSRSYFSMFQASSVFVLLPSPKHDATFWTHPQTK